MTITLGRGRPSPGQLAAPALAIGGFAPFSTCDWPGELVATLFLRGCPLACRYCHNPDLRRRAKLGDLKAGDLKAGDPNPGEWSFETILAGLARRRGLLDGVVFSGGEPTLDQGLPDAVTAVRALGFKVGLHTAGPYPERFAKLLPALDWVGFDVKAPFALYERITGVPASGERARASLVHLAASGVPHDLRTTVHPLLLDEHDLERLDADLADLGLPPSRRQPFRSQGCLDRELTGSSTGGLA